MPLVTGLLTVELLRRVMPNLSAERASIFIPHLITWCDAWTINTPRRLAAFLAQAAHESGELLRLVENLNYSADRLIKVWPVRFGHGKKATAAQRAAGLLKARQLARKPVAIANFVYGGRMGNGPESSGDGWMYRGRGIFQLTGKDNYARAGAALGLDLVGNPDQVAGPPAACATAAWFWASNGLNELAEADRFTDLTRRINGGTIGMQERKVFWARARGALAVSV